MVKIFTASSLLAFVLLASLAFAEPTNSGNDPLSAASRALSTDAPLKARQIALDVFENARTQDMRNRSARMIAASFASQRRWTAAQIWLRRAANYANSRNIADATRYEYQLVRNENPLTAEFAFSVSPSNNINRGVESREFNLGRYELLFPKSSLALSGMEFTTTARLGYRLSSGARHRTTAYLDLFDQRYMLSENTQQKAPEARAGDYMLSQASVALQHDFWLLDGLGPSIARLRFSKSWSGGSPLRESRGLELGQKIRLSERVALQIGARITEDFGLGFGEPNAQDTSLSATLTAATRSDDEFSFGLRRSFYDADQETYRHGTSIVFTHYAHSKPILNTMLSLDANAIYRDYSDFFLSLDGRRDFTSLASVTATFVEITRYGFSPALTITAERTWSNVARYDTQRVGANITFVSNF